MKNFFDSYSSDEVESVKEKNKLMQVRKKEFEILKEKLEKQFNFEITDYIIEDILDYETYHHVVLMVNMAIINNRLLKGHGEKLKAGIKELFKVNGEYDRIDKTVYIGEIFDFNKLYEK